MNFIKKYWLWFVVIGLVGVIWYLYNQNQKNKATVAAIVLNPNAVTDYAEGGYDGSGISGGIDNII